MQKSNFTQIRHVFKKTLKTRLNQWFAGIFDNVDLIILTHININTKYGDMLDFLAAWAASWFIDHCDHRGIIVTQLSEEWEEWFADQIANVFGVQRGKSNSLQ